MTTLPGLFVVGTDTGVGKTRVAAAIARCLCNAGRRPGVLKPIATGCALNGTMLVSSDAELLLEAIGRFPERNRVVPLVFEEPLAPCVAARRESIGLTREFVETEVLGALNWWAHHADVMVVEGVGGLLCPLADTTTLADLAVLLDYPLVIVVRNGLGALNHTLLTVEAARARGLRIAGLVLNSVAPTFDDVAEVTNGEELARRLPGVPILAQIAYHSDPAAISDALISVDWYERAGLPRFPFPHRS